jgi:hypothetical protein
MLRFTIPTPCHEDWNQMQPNEIGRHCNVCSKTVVDFTYMSDEQVKNYLLSKPSGQTCGRFNNTQLQTIRIPADILYSQMPAWKRFLVACLIVFSTTLFACGGETTTLGETKGKSIVTGFRTTGMPVYDSVPYIMPRMQPGNDNVELIVDSSGLDKKQRNKIGAVVPEVSTSVGIIAIEPDNVLVEDTSTLLVGDIQMVPDTVIYVDEPM